MHSQNFCSTLQKNFLKVIRSFTSGFIFRKNLSFLCRLLIRLYIVTYLTEVTALGKKTSIYDFELDKNIQIILTETVAGP